MRRRCGTAPLVAALLVAGLSGPGLAQEPVSRLDRVIHGLSYRPLAGGTPAAEAEAGAVARSPHDDAVRYRVDDRVQRSTDGGATWAAMSPVLASGPLTSVSESPVEPGLLWAGATDGSLHLSRDGGLSWTRIAMEPPGAAGGGSTDGGGAPKPLAPAGAPVRDVLASAYRGGTAYVRLGAPDGVDPVPLLFRTDDYGEAWVALAGPGKGLPVDVPLTAFAEDPEGSKLLFAGTPTGVYVSFDDGGSWDLFRLNMPEAAITDLRIVQGHLFVETEAQGRFVLDEIGPLRQVMRGLLTGEPYLFEPPPVTVDAEPRMAFLDYLLPSFVRRVQVEILDGAGRWITTVRGEERPEGGERPQGTRAGVHRVTWDLSYVGPDGRALTAAPGSYTVRMTVDGLVRERILEILGPEDG